MRAKAFVALRIIGRIDETGKWMNKSDYVDITISREETKRIVTFLQCCLGADSANTK